MAEDLIVKSVRLTSAEVAALAELAGRLHTTEAALLRRFAIDGTRQTQLDEGILAYVKGQSTLAQAARIAHLPEEGFDEQLKLRGIFGPGTPDAKTDPKEDTELFWVSLRRIAEAVGDDRLLQVAERMRAEREDSKPVRA